MSNVRGLTIQPMTHCRAPTAMMGILFFRRSPRLPMTDYLPPKFISGVAEFRDELRVGCIETSVQFSLLFSNTLFLTVTRLSNKT